MDYRGEVPEETESAIETEVGADGYAVWKRNAVVALFVLAGGTVTAIAYVPSSVSLTIAQQIGNARHLVLIFDAIVAAGAVIKGMQFSGWAVSQDLQQAAEARKNQSLN